MINEKDIEAFKLCVANRLVEKYGLEKSDALKAVQSTTLAKVLKKFPSEALHYSVNYWAEDVMEELKEMEWFEGDK